MPKSVIMAFSFVTDDCQGKSALGKSTAAKITNTNYSKTYETHFSCFASRHLLIFGFSEPNKSEGMSCWLKKKVFANYFVVDLLS